MRPGLRAIEAEIVGVGSSLTRRFFRLDDAVFDAFALGVGFGKFLTFKGQAHLLLHVSGRCIAKDRIDPAWLFLVEFEEPEMRLGFARLHCSFCGTIDLGRHELKHPTFASVTLGQLLSATLF